MTGRERRGEGATRRRGEFGQRLRVSASPRPRVAFTLLETLIAITVLAIVASVVLMSAGSSGTQRIESVARVLAADLRLARSLSIAHSTQWSVRFDVEENAYELVHTGSGSPPPLDNPLAPDEETYRIVLGRLGTTAGKDNGVRLAGVALENSLSSVTDVTFGPLGGTGPLKSDDTVILLIQGTGSQTQAVKLTVSWITGQVWIDRDVDLKTLNRKALTTDYQPLAPSPY